jgi:hypothetical protein
MSAESFNACEYLVDRKVQAGLGGHLAITGPAGSLTYAELAARAAGPEEVVACVVPVAGQQLDADGLIAFRRDGLASFKRPRQVLALDALPKTATGKIQRGVVRDVVAQRLAGPGR